MDKSILEVVHDSAKDLHESGAMKETTLREFDALCLPPVKEFTAEQIKRIRMKNKASQAVFAAYLNTGKSTVQKWEQGKKKPNGPSLKLLNLVAERAWTCWSREGIQMPEKNFLRKFLSMVFFMVLRLSQKISQ